MVLLIARYGLAAEPAADSESLAWQDTGLSISIDLPDRGAAYCDESGDLQLGLQTAELDPSLQGAAVEYLRRLEKTNPKLARFLAGQGYYPVSAKEKTLIQPLPPFSNLVLYARGVLPGVVAWRTNRLVLGQVTDVRFLARELFPVAAAVVAAKGRLTLEETEVPAAGAKIHASSYCYAEDAVADAQGDFVLKSLPLGRMLTVDIAGADTQTPPRYRFSVRRVLWPRSEADVGAMNWRIPASRVLVVKLGGYTIRKGSEYPLFGLDALQDDATWKFRRVQGIEGLVDSLGLVQSRPGTIRARIHESVFVVRYSEPVKFGSQDYRKETRLVPAPLVREKVHIDVVDQNARPVTGAQVTFASLEPGGIPLQLITDDKGEVSIGPVNVEALNVTVDAAAGVFAGRVTLAPPGEVTSIRVQSVSPPDRP